MPKTAYRSNKKGFTLVELLVVITIIAILSTVGLVIFSGAQKSGRIAKRIGDLKAIQTALEIYYSANKAYPAFGWRSECIPWGGVSSDQVIPGLVPTYMPAFPSDPSMNRNTDKNCYIYTSNNGVDYKLLDYNIAEFSSTDIQSQRNLIDPARNSGSALCNGTPGGPALTWAVWSSATSACW